MTTEEQRQEAPDLLASIWRYKYLVTALATVAAVAAYWISSLQPPRYDATASLALTNPGSRGVFEEGSTRLIDPSQYVPQRAERVMSRPVLERASAALGDSLDAEQLRQRVTVNYDLELETLEISGSGPTGEEAAAIANAVVGAYQGVELERAQGDAEAAVAELQSVRAGIQEQIDAIQAQVAEAQQAASAPQTDAPESSNLLLNSRLEALNAQLLDLQSRAQQIMVETAVHGSGVDYVETAQVPENPSSPKPIRNAAIALVLGGGLASAFAFRKADRNQRIESRSAPERILGAPLLGEIPVYKSHRRSSDLAERLALPVGAAEAYEFVLSSVEYALGSVNGSAIVVTSAAPEDGKTSTALQLSIAAARSGRRVTLVDADSRAQGLSRVFGANRGPGLTDLAANEATLGDVTRRFLLSANTTLSVIPAGRRPARSSAMLRSRAFGPLLQRLKEQADLLILDSPPLLATADAAVVASHIDGIVLVVNAGTPVDHLRLVRERLEFTGTPLLGYVYNRSGSAVTSYYDYGLSGTQRQSIRVEGTTSTDLKSRSTHASESDRTSPTHLLDTSKLR